MTGTLLLGVSYLAIAVFAVGLIYRAIKIAKLPVHLRWELSPVPHEKGRNRYGGSYFEEYEWWTKKREKDILAEVWYMFQEIVFLKGVWKHKPRLWWFSFPFHFGGLYLPAGMIGLVVLGAALRVFGIQDIALLNSAVTALGVAGYLLGCIGALGLLYRRTTDSSIRPFTSVATVFNLLFLLAVFASGVYAAASVDGFASLMIGYVHSLLTAGAVGLPAPVALHVLLGLLFLIYLPFTYMMHFVAKFFTYHEVRWNDEPMKAGGRMEKEVGALLNQPVSWSAPHIKADGKKNWVAVATEEVKDG